jgi:hypothetical protein
VTVAVGADDDEDPAPEVVSVKGALVGVEEAVPPMGAVDWPLICAWTEALKVPVMPVRLPEG